MSSSPFPFIPVPALASPLPPLPMPSFHLSISAALSLNTIFSNSSSPLCAAFPSAGGAAKLQPSSLSIASYGPPIAVAVLRYDRQQPCRRAPILLVAKMLFTSSVYVCMYVCMHARGHMRYVRVHL
eukprot:GHVU01023737.1.p1 GENE.GHVU01023737.1~~GHVU01023737.1.p1  ORF type:complete len:126 (-),score=7.28 GHVU01023737.1:120-497(-)